MGAQKCLYVCVNVDTLCISRGAA